MTIRKAVFPVAGLGTRFLPATKANPKEMLPVVDKPLIQYAVEEAVAAGMTEMIFVTGRSKRSIPDHFDKAFELEVELERKGKNRMLELVRNIVPPHVSCIYIRQPEALGLGHAVLCAAPAVGNEPFAVLLADDLMVPSGPGLGAAQSLVLSEGALETQVVAQEHRHFGCEQARQRDTPEVRRVAPGAARDPGVGAQVEVLDEAVIRFPIEKAQLEIDAVPASGSEPLPQ